MADIQPRKSINRTHGPDAPHGEFRVVGKRARKVDGIHKATGQALYTDDISSRACCTASSCAARTPTRSSSASTRAGRSRWPRARRDHAARTCPSSTA
jgi:hypothetical protein